MKQKIAAVVLAAAAVFFCAQAFCQEAPAPAAGPAAPQAAVPQAAAPQPDEAKVKVIAVATEAVKAAGITVEDVNIVYDEGGKLWSERLGYASETDTPNHGVLKRGFLKNYRIVYFDYKEPIKDVWVFIDKDTGEVLEVYREQ